MANRAGVRLTLKEGSDEELSLIIMNEFLTKVLSNTLGYEENLEKDMRLRAKEAYEKGIATKYIDLLND